MRYPLAGESRYYALAATPEQGPDLSDPTQFFSGEHNLPSLFICSPQSYLEPNRRRSCVRVNAMAVAECTDAVAQTLSDVYIECPQIAHFFCALEESEDPKKDSHLRTFLFRGACSNSKVFVCIFPEKCTSLSSFGQTVPQTSHMYFLTDRPFFGFSYQLRRQIHL